MRTTGNQFRKHLESPRKPLGKPWKPLGKTLKPWKNTGKPFKKKTKPVGKNVAKTIGNPWKLTTFKRPFFRKTTLGKLQGKPLEKKKQKAVFLRRVAPEPAKSSSEESESEARGVGGAFSGQQEHLGGSFVFLACFCFLGEFLLGVLCFLR